MATSTDKQSDYQARGLAEMRRRAEQRNDQSNKDWAKLDGQAVALQQRIAAAHAAGNVRAEDLARRALGGIVRAMGKLLAAEPVQPVGLPTEPWARR